MFNRRFIVVSADPRLHAALVSAAKVMRCIQCSLTREHWIQRIAFSIFEVAERKRGSRVVSFFPSVKLMCVCVCVCVDADS